MFSPCSKNLPGTSLGVPRTDLRPASTGEHTADGRGGPWESIDPSARRSTVRQHSATIWVCLKIG